MKKNVIVAAIAAAVLVPHAFAQANNFQGFSILGSINANDNKMDVSVRSTGANASESKSTSNASLQGEYAWGLGNVFVLGVGLNASLSDYDAASGVKLKNTNSVYVAPGYAISNETLIYGKLASLSGKVDAGPVSVDISGVGYGLGVRYFSSKNVFLQAEYVYNSYDDKTLANGVLKNKTGVLGLGIGYKF